MHNLTNILDEFGLSGTVLSGLDKLVGEDKALDAWGKLETEWKFVLNHRVTSRIGQCRYPNPHGFRRRRLFGEIEIHGLLMAEGREETRNNTILHEVAHAVNKMLFGTNDNHGPNWKRIMRVFGLRPERCNTNSEVSALLHAKKVKKANLLYACQRCEHEFPAMRKKKHPAEIYTHKRCGGKLYLKSNRWGEKFANPSKSAS